MSEGIPALQEVTQTTWLVRKVAVTVCWGLILGLRSLVWLATGVGYLLRSRSRREKVDIVLTGRFASDGWVDAHVRPLATSKWCGQVWVVTDSAMLQVPNTTYVVAPRWLQVLVGRVPARSLYCILTSIRYRPDMVGGFHLLLNGIVALLGARCVGARAVYFCVGGWTETWGGGARSENRLFRRIGKDNQLLEREILRFVGQMDLTLTMGTRARKYFREHGATRPIVVMPGGIQRSRFCTGNALLLRPYDVIFVGRFVPIKRLDVFLEVIAKVLKKRPGVRTVILGDGPMRPQLERRAAQLGISETLLFVGHRSDVESWLHKAKVFVLTSDSEGLALSVMEAMTAGLPVVVSDVGDLADLVRDGVNGYRPPRRDADAFALRIVELLSREDKYQAFSAEATRSAMAYSLQSTRIRWDRLLAEWSHSGTAGRPRGKLRT